MQDISNEERRKNIGVDSIILKRNLRHLLRNRFTLILFLLCTLFIARIIKRDLVESSILKINTAMEYAVGFDKDKLKIAVNGNSRVSKEFILNLFYEIPKAHVTFRDLKDVENKLKDVGFFDSVKVKKSLFGGFVVVRLKEKAPACFSIKKSGVRIFFYDGTQIFLEYKDPNSSVDLSQVPVFNEREAVDVNLLLDLLRCFNLPIRSLEAVDYTRINLELEDGSIIMLPRFKQPEAVNYYLKNIEGWRRLNPDAKIYDMRIEGYLFLR